MARTCAWSGNGVPYKTGIDTPETGGRAKCERERILGKEAKKRLAELLRELAHRGHRATSIRQPSAGRSCVSGGVGNWRGTSCSARAMRSSGDEDEAAGPATAARARTSAPTPHISRRIGRRHRVQPARATIYHPADAPVCDPRRPSPSRRGRTAVASRTCHT